MHNSKPVALAAITIALSPMTAAAQDHGTSFSNLVEDSSTHITYAHVPSRFFAAMADFRQRSLVTPLDFTEIFDMPHQPHGIPGVAVFDYDNDGDEDLYVANGPGAPNSLFANQLVQSGKADFVDVAAAAGVEATTQDSSGVCYGDVDNDGDADLLVLGRSEPNVLYVNDGQGHFTRLAGSAFETDSLGSSSCSMGDVNQDGLLDVVISNAGNHSRYSPCFVEVFSENEANQLFLNRGGLVFEDVSASAGLLDLNGFPPDVVNGQGITWAAAMVDIDSDGDTDMVFADEQCGIPRSRDGGTDRGFIHVLLNNGSAHFEDFPIHIDDQSIGAWMGLSFGDLNCDGHLDLFASNAGDFDFSTFKIPYMRGDLTTRWFLGNGDGTFTDPGVGDLVATPFAWGNAIADFDNDGDQDIVFQGGLELDYQLWADNPGIVLSNEACTAQFTWDKDALATDYIRRNVRGLAIGDLDHNGFVDFATVSNFDIPQNVPLLPTPAQYGSPFDPTAYYVEIFEAQVTSPSLDQFVWTGLDVTDGSLTIELNKGNTNRSSAVRLIGSVGLTPAGVVNRDGAGAVLTFTPTGGHRIRVPVPSGPSFASQHSLETLLGLGTASEGDLEILWPGGVKNRLYGVQASERIVVPEIPCSYAGAMPAAQYNQCLNTALTDLRAQGVISAQMAARLRASAERAYSESHR